jgi:hypothetical protein
METKKMNMMRLSDYCRWNNLEKLQRLLAEHKDLDLSAINFRRAIEHNNRAMLNTLLNYYKETKLQLDQDQQDLSYMLEEATEETEISPEIQRTINPYMPHTEEGIILREIKQNLSKAGFTLPHFHGHLDQVGFNDASEDDMRAVLNELENLKSRLHYMYSNKELDANVQLMEDQIHYIKEFLDPSVDLEGFDAIPDEWDCDEDDDIGLNTSKSTSHDYAVELIGNENEGDLAEIQAAEDGLSPHSPYITSY